MDSAGRQSVAMLRGAAVEVNAQRVIQSVSVLTIAALVVLIVAFVFSGLHRNAEVSNLKQHGVVVTVTVTTCVGELGGSGSNLADYRCEGKFILDGQRHVDTIPGHAFRANGTTAEFLTASNSPGQLATSSEVKHESTSMSVFILPSILLVVLIGLLAIVARRRTLRRTGG